MSPKWRRRLWSLQRLVNPKGWLQAIKRRHEASQVTELGLLLGAEGGRTPRNLEEVLEDWPVVEI